MDKVKLLEAAETHETWVVYYSEAWANAVNAGSTGSAETNLDLAAKHAAIALCLRSQASGGDQQ